MFDNLQRRIRVYHGKVYGRLARSPARAKHAPNRAYQVELYLLLAPYLFGATLLVAVPVLLSFGLSLFRYDALSPPTWNGLRNFVDILNEPLFSVSLSNSIYFIYLAVPLRLLGALGLALLYNRPRRGTSIYRAAAYLPTMIPDMAYALLWLWILNPLHGPLNQLLGAFGLPAPAWLVDPATAKFAIVLIFLFQIGEGFVVMLVGLKNIPQDYYDSAQVDGSSRLQIFRFITLPFLKPWLVLLIFRDVILSFQSTFIPAFVMTGGDPYYTTLFMPLLIYEEAFDRLRFGPGSAMMLLMFLITLALLLILYGTFQGWGHEE